MTAEPLHPIAVKDFQFDLTALSEQLHITDDTEQMAELRALVEEASAAAHPAAAYRLVYIDDRGDDYVILNGVRFTSRVLRVNVHETDRAFAGVATCGTELEQWAEQQHDILYGYWSEAIRLQALSAASRALIEDIERRFNPGHMAAMNPGSLTDWPLHQQRPFFSLLGDVETAVGVILQPSLLMWPTKSVSSLFFPTASDFTSCQLCPRQGCPNRRAPYQAAQMEQYLSGS